MDLSTRAFRSFRKEDALMLYYVNKNAQANGTHEVHRQDCTWLPDAENRICLGSFYNGKDAVKTAQKYYDDVDGCYYCCREAHND